MGVALGPTWKIPEGGARRQGPAHHGCHVGSDHPIVLANGSFSPVATCTKASRSWVWYTSHWPSGDQLTAFETYSSGPRTISACIIIEGSIRNAARPACTSAGRWPFNEASDASDDLARTLQLATRITAPELPEMPSGLIATPCYSPHR